MVSRLFATATLWDGQVHERDLQTDFLLVILRDLLPKRPDLRVVLMSATLQARIAAVHTPHHYVFFIVLGVVEKSAVLRKGFVFNPSRGRAGSRDGIVAPTHFR